MISACWSIPCPKAGSVFGTWNPENQWTWKAMKYTDPGRQSLLTDPHSWLEETEIPCGGGISMPLPKLHYGSPAKVRFSLATALPSLHSTTDRSSYGILQRGR